MFIYQHTFVHAAMSPGPDFQFSTFLAKPVPKKIHLHDAPKDDKSTAKDRAIRQTTCILGAKRRIEGNHSLPLPPFLAVPLHTPTYFTGRECSILEVVGEIIGDLALYKYPVVKGELVVGGCDLGIAAAFLEELIYSVEGNVGVRQ